METIRGSMELNDKINEIKMEVAFYEYKDSDKIKPYLIVEGFTDICFFKKFIDEEKCNIEEAKGKKNVIEIVKELKNENNIMIFGIIDADFWHIDNKQCPLDCILVTDFHDIEIMMIDSISFESLMSEFMDKEKIQDSHWLQDDNISYIILKECSKIGYFRYLIHKNSRFDFLDLNKIEFNEITDNNGKIKMEKLIKHVLKNSDDYILEKSNLVFDLEETIDEKYFEKRIKELMSNNFEINQICRGHDVTQYLVFLFKNIFGNKNKCMPPNREKIESNLRISYNFECFKETSLYNQILNICSINRWDILKN
ncbi:MAG: DUF4435 domain-containing protein [Candidatus Lokiarchaeota archaeon]|nr:DUF4435 domain-containing protein [Candidatus Lokiarchaeota archaeon]